MSGSWKVLTFRVTHSRQLWKMVAGLRFVSVEEVGKVVVARAPPRRAQERRNGLFHLTLMQASV